MDKVMIFASFFPALMLGFCFYKAYTDISRFKKRRRIPVNTKVSAGAQKAYPAASWFEAKKIPAVASAVLLVNTLAIVIVIASLSPRIARHGELLFIILTAIVPLTLTMMVCAFEQFRKAAVVASVCLIVSGAGVAAYIGIDGPYHKIKKTEKRMKYTIVECSNLYDDGQSEPM